MLCDLRILTIQTPRLKIRGTCSRDLEQIFEMHRVDEVNRFIPYETWQSMSDAHDWFQVIEQRRQQNDAEHFVILEGQTVVGTIIVFNFEPEASQIEIGYVLNRNQWGKGLMFEALSGFIPKMAEQLHLTLINAIVEQENSASAKLLGRLGFICGHTSSIKENGLARNFYLQH